MEILRTQDLFKSFGGLCAINQLSFGVKRGLIKAVIGPNGAGKTTLINLISGLHTAGSGNILFEGASINKLKPYHITALGIARTFQTLSVFSELTVLENVMMGCHVASKTSLLSTICRIPFFKNPGQEQEIEKNSKEYLDYVGFKKSPHSITGILPFVDQRLVEIARTLACQPHLLLMDEPAAGLSEPDREVIKKLLLKIKQDKVTILLIEHNMDLVMEISDEILVLNYGLKIGEGPPHEMRRNKKVIHAYLGEET